MRHHVRYAGGVLGAKDVVLDDEGTRFCGEAEHHVRHAGSALGAKDVVLDDEGTRVSGE